MMTWTALFFGTLAPIDVQETNELLMAMTLHAVAKDLALKDIERHEQGMTP